MDKYFKVIVIALKHLIIFKFKSEYIESPIVKVVNQIVCFSNANSCEWRFKRESTHL